MSTTDFAMLEWSDAELDAFFVQAETQPLHAFVNREEHRVDLAAHEIYNDRRWRGFMPLGLPATEATARLSLGFAKKIWTTSKGFGGETQYFGGAIATRHTVQEVVIERHTNDIPPGRYILLGYTDPIFATLFYDLLKPVGDDLMIFRGYTGQFPEGKRGWTALLLRRYPFGQMGIDDHEILYARGSSPTEDVLVGGWRVEALYHSNRPAPIAALSIARAPDGRLTLRAAPGPSPEGVLLPTFVSKHFQTENLPDLRQELRVVDDRYLVGKWTTTIRGPYAKFLVAGSPGLFHRDKDAGRSRFSLYYLLTRTAPA